MFFLLYSGKLQVPKPPIKSENSCQLHVSKIINRM